MKHLLIILLFLSLSVNAQEGMVMVSGDVSHQIDVPDNLSYDVVMRWKFEMKQEMIEFQAPLRKIDRIEYVERDYHYLGEIKNRVIYLNSALNEYPNCKKAAIIQMLYINAGGKVEKNKKVRATSNFNVSKISDSLFKKQYDNGYIFKTVARKLKTKN